MHERMFLKLIVILRFKCFVTEQLGTYKKYVYVYRQYIPLISCFLFISLIAIWICLLGRDATDV